MGKRQRARLREAAVLTEQAVLHGDVVAIDEAKLRADGTVPIRLITPGWGTSGYYSAEVIERDGPTAFPAGTQMFWDHPSESEKFERPERSLRDLAGTLATGARWVADHYDGPGLYAEAQVLTPYRPLLAEIAPHIGVSIRAAGTKVQGEAEGRRGPVVERLAEGFSVDFVTRAGRGGSVLSLLESARVTLSETMADDVRQRLRNALNDRFGGTDAYVWVRDFDPDEQVVIFDREGDAVADPGTYRLAYVVDDSGNAVLDDSEPTEVKVTTTYTPVTAPVTASEEDEMPITDEEKSEITESVAAAVISKLTEAGVVKPAEDNKPDELAEATARAQRAEEALLVTAAEAHIVANDKVKALPDVTAKRLAETLAKSATATDDGKLDTAKLDEAIATAVKAEVAYLAEATGSPVRGVGSGAAPSTSGDDTDTKLAEAFQGLGLSESAAKVAARGR